MRVFIGINFSEDIKDNLFTIENDLRQNTIKGNFTLKNNLHLTLQFIGEVNEEELSLLKDVVIKTASNFNRFTFKVNGVGEFRSQRGQIVYAAVEYSKELDQLYNFINEELRKKGLTFERRPYTPHITLAREVQYQSTFNINDFRFIQFVVNVDKLTLFESTRINGLLTYLPIIEVNLKK